MGTGLSEWVEVPTCLGKPSLRSARRSQAFLEHCDDTSRAGFLFSIFVRVVNLSMQKVDVLQEADSDAASDDSEPPEAVELTPGMNTPVYSTCGSTAAPGSTSAQHDADALPPAPVTIITGFLGAGAS